MKVVKSPGYNYIFNPKNGYFARWGNTHEDDPVMSPFGPEIADIEITTSCSGPEGKVCGFCYKANTPIGENMSLETFKTIFAKLPKNLTQIAFGADATGKANPDMWKIMEYCRTNDINPVIPNITIANADLVTARKLADTCGAVAVSRYDNKNVCYDTVQRLTTFGLKQTNIHQLLAEETFDNVIETIHDIKNDDRLKELNAIVFLSLKKKGRGKGYTPLSQEKFEQVINMALEAEIPFGFDSCSANKFLKATKNHPRASDFAVMAEPCESTCFSLYVNVEGKYFPCSFSEGHDFGRAGDWSDGIDLTKINSFIPELWNNQKTLQFRNALLNNLDELGVRKCPLYEI